MPCNARATVSVALRSDVLQSLLAQASLREALRLYVETLTKSRPVRITVSGGSIAITTSEWTARISGERVTMDTYSMSRSRLNEIAGKIQTMAGDLVKAHAVNAMVMKLKSKYRVLSDQRADGGRVLRIQV